MTQDWNRTKESVTNACERVLVHSGAKSL